MHSDVQTPESDRSARLAKWVHACLLIGVATSAVTLSLGLLLALRSGTPRPEEHLVQVSTVLKNTLNGNPVAILYCGLLLLMLTPLARVAVLVLGWWLEGERRFALVALSVLLLLIASLWIGTA